VNCRAVNRKQALLKAPGRLQAYFKVESPMAGHHHTEN